MRFLYFGCLYGIWLLNRYNYSGLYFKGRNFGELLWFFRKIAKVKSRKKCWMSSFAKVNSREICGFEPFAKVNSREKCNFQKFREKLHYRNLLMRKLHFFSLLLKKNSRKAKTNPPFAKVYSYPLIKDARLGTTIISNNTYNYRIIQFFLLRSFYRFWNSSLSLKLPFNDYNIG